MPKRKYGMEEIVTVLRKYSAVPGEDLKSDVVIMESCTYRKPCPE
jgi:hypothetical protein